MLLSATIVDGQTLVDGVHLTEGVRLDQETLTVEGTAADDAVLLWNNRVAVGSSNSADADYIRISRNGKLAIIAADLVSTVVVNGGDGNDRLAASADGFTQTADEDRTFWSQSLSVSAAISITAGVGDDIVYAAASDTAIDAGEGTIMFAAGPGTTRSPAERGSIDFTAAMETICSAPVTGMTC